MEYFILYCFCSITDVTELKLTVEKLKLQNKLLDHAGNYIHAIIPELLTLIHKALNIRVKLVQIKQQPVSEVLILIKAI